MESIRNETEEHTKAKKNAHDTQSITNDGSLRMMK